MFRPDDITKNTAISALLLIFAQNQPDMEKGPISQFIQHHYRHFNSATLVDAAKAYESHLLGGGKMMITLAGAMSTA